jgi:hypothetical protein
LRAPQAGQRVGVVMARFRQDLGGVARYSVAADRAKPAGK